MRQPFAIDASSFSGSPNALRTPRQASDPVRSAYAGSKPSFCRVCELGHKAVVVFAAAVFFGMVAFAIFG